MKNKKPVALGKGQTGLLTDYGIEPNTNLQIRKRGNSLRKAINEHCKDCIYDDVAAGTWLQQVTICTSKKCPLYIVRLKSKSSIAESVLSYYGIKTATSQDSTSIHEVQP